MTTPQNDFQRIEEAFDHARRELRGDDSILAQIESRIASTAIEPAPRVFQWSVLTCLTLFVVSLALWCGLGSKPSPSTSNEEALQSAGNVGLEIGDTKLVEHLAAMMSDRSVLVIWSYQGNGVSPEPTDLAEHREGKYRFRRLDQTQLSDGRMLVCSLFIPDQDVHPIFEPPAISARSSDGGVIRFSAQPTRATQIELSDAVRAIGFGGNETKKILREAQTRND